MEAVATRAPLNTRWRACAIPAAVVILVYGSTLLPDAMKFYPKAWVVPFVDWFRELMAWLTQDTPQIPGLPPIREFTRAFAGGLNYLLDFFKSLFATGFHFRPGDGPADLPPLPWYLVISLAALLGWRLGGRKLAIITFAGLLFIAFTGNWTSAMLTLASVIVAAALAAIAGVAIGALAYRSKTFDRLLSPFLDLMQTVPVFAYLVPALMLLGFGPAAASAATIIYALPPMIRSTVLGLRRVPSETSEFGRIAGCTPFQMMIKVLLPSALPSIMLGINQMTMMTLNMVIIASMIGAGGLGYDVLTALRRLDIGSGLEAGLAIVALAVILDRQSQAAAQRSGDHKHDEQASFFMRHRVTLALIAITVVTYAIGLFEPATAYFPHDFVFSARASLNEFARWIAVNLSGPLSYIKTAFLWTVMIPTRNFIGGLPWFVPPLLVGMIGYAFSGFALALLSSVLVFSIFAAGLQEPALNTIYLCGLGTIFSLLFGIPLGIWGAKSERAHAVLGAICDTLQTLPSFVYLIPVVMLFRVGDYSALIAIVAFAIVPAIRYTDFGIRRVPKHYIEASLMSGGTREQVLREVELPLAVPEILLGVSQTIMMALSMLVITALVGTRDLGQETYIALAKADAGRGIVAGLAIAFLAIVADRLVSAWSHYRFRQLHLT